MLETSPGNPGAGTSIVMFAQVPVPDKALVRSLDQRGARWMGTRMVDWFWFHRTTFSLPTFPTAVGTWYEKQVRSPAFLEFGHLLFPSLCPVSDPL